MAAVGVEPAPWEALRALVDAGRLAALYKVPAEELAMFGLEPCIASRVALRDI